MRMVRFSLVDYAVHGLAVDTATGSIYYSIQTQVIRFANNKTIVFNGTDDVKGIAVDPANR